MTRSGIKYQRVLLKLTGELFGGKEGRGINFTSFEEIAKQIVMVSKRSKIQLAIVVGGGNIFRGRERATRVDEPTADYMGMLATVINGLALQEATERAGVPTRMMTAFEIKSVAEPYIRRRAIRHLEKGRIVILTAGIGSPFFTTDSGAALRAIELNCNLLLKATNVDGVYSDDPRKNKNAKLFRNITFDEAIKKDINVMDTTAFSLCRKHNMPIIVFNINNLNKIDKILKGNNMGTFVSNKKPV